MINSMQATVQAEVPPNLPQHGSNLLIVDTQENLPPDSAGQGKESTEILQIDEK